jgi:hypothetical protein
VDWKALEIVHPDAAGIDVGRGSMRLQSRKVFLVSTVAAVLFTAMAFADSHESLNGTWILVPTTGDGGAPEVKTAAITITDREHNIYISRNFTFDDSSQTVSYSFTTDRREDASIRQGKTFKSKAKWDGNVLKVTTIRDNVTEREEYSLRPDSLLMLVIERPGHPPLTLYFQHQ